MGWVHDDTKTQSVDVETAPPPPPPEQGFARVVGVTTDKVTAKPGDDIKINGVVHNDGGTDKLRIVLGFQEFIGADFKEESRTINANTDYAFSATMKIPLDYTGTTITALCFGFHEE